VGYFVQFVNPVRGIYGVAFKVTKSIETIPVLSVVRRCCQFACLETSRDEGLTNVDSRQIDDRSPPASSLPRGSLSRRYVIVPQPLTFVCVKLGAIWLSRYFPQRSSCRPGRILHISRTGQIYLQTVVKNSAFGLCCVACTTSNQA